MAHITQKPLTSYPDPAERDAYVSDAVIWGWFFFLNLLIWPRVVMLAFWIFGSEIGRAFHHHWVIPVVGFLFLPFTTIAYAFLWASSSDGVHGAEWIPVVLCFGLDLITLSLGRSLTRRR